MVIPLIFSILHAASPIPQDSIVIRLDTAKFVCTVSKRMNGVNDKIIKSTNKTLDKAQKQEEKIYRKLLKTKDSLYARAQLGELNKKYAAIRNQLENPAIPGLAKQYLPHLDSLNISLQFLGKDGVGKIPGLQSAASLQDRFKQADIVKDFLRERKEELRSRLEGLGLVKQLKHLNKQVYYYAQQIKEYKEILKDPTKIEKKVIELLSKTKAWKDFFKKNSVLASLFRLPDDPMDPAFNKELAIARMLRNSFSKMFNLPSRN
jgi:Mg2+ and Co2+ transporter CorA